MDREGTALDPEVVTCQYAEIRERSLSSSRHAPAVLSSPSSRCRGRSIDSGRIVPALALTRRDPSTSRRTRDSWHYNGRRSVLRIEVWTEFHRRHPVVSAAGISGHSKIPFPDNHQSRYGLASNPAGLCLRNSRHYPRIRLPSNPCTGTRNGLDRFHRSLNQLPPEQSRRRGQQEGRPVARSKS